MLLVPFLIRAFLPIGAGGTTTVVGRSISIEDFLVGIQVNEASSLDVTETLRLRFNGQWEGIHRFIPVESRSPNGVPHRIGLRLHDVTDDCGRHLKVQRSRHGDDVDLKIYVPDAADALRTVIIRYRVDNGVRFLADHDELYWNVTGDQWPYPIGSARAKITLPERLVNVRANAFTGATGSKEQAVSIKVDGVAHEPENIFKPAGESPPPPGGSHVVDIEASRVLGIREGLTAAVAWNPGVIRRPSVWARTWSSWREWCIDQRMYGLIAAVPLAALALLSGSWWLIGRDPKEGPVVVQYEPPRGLGPGEAGTLFDGTCDSRDLIANLVDAAVKGVVRIRAAAPAGWFTPASYEFDLLEPESEWTARGIGNSGTMLLRGMFKSGSTHAAGPDGVLATKASTRLRGTFGRHVRRVRNAMYDDLVTRGLYGGSPEKVRKRYESYGKGFAFAIAVSFSVLMATLQETPPARNAYCIAGFLSVVATAGIFTFFARIMPARTMAGARTRTSLRGFKEFLARVDAHRLGSMPLTPELFGRYLPYAIALGVERRWIRAFAEICTQPPTWYADERSLGTFGMGSFAAAIGHMSHTTAAAMTYSPGSEAGSGFSDGGGSGGGDGGGGGTGF